MALGHERHLSGARAQDLERSWVVLDWGCF
jgi:hypothetical protein